MVSGKMEEHGEEGHGRENQGGIIGITWYKWGKVLHGDMKALKFNEIVPEIIIFF